MNGDRERARGPRSARVGLLMALIPVAAVGQQQNAQAPALVFDGVTVIDVVHGTLVPQQRVVIVGNRIQTVDQARSVKKPRGARVIDARGKYLIPGLWDLHVHPDYLAPSYFNPLFLATGVTGIRDASSSEPLARQLQWRREILAGTRVGPPRQLLSGVAIDADPQCLRTHSGGGLFPSHTCILSDDTLDERQLVDSLKAAGADLLKIYGNTMSPDDAFRLAATARRLGLPYGGHLTVPPLLAADSGWSIIDHYAESGELLQFCGPTAAMERCQALAEQFRQHNTWWVPTLQTHDGPAPPSQALERRFREYFDQFWADSLTSLAGLGPMLRAVHQAGRATAVVDSSGYLSVAQRVGMPILAGTDVRTEVAKSLPPGFSLHLELAIEVAEGLTPLNALQSATLDPAKMWRATDSLGTVAPGKLADLVLLDANPLADITNTLAIRAVVANGRYFDRAVLDQILAGAWTTMRVGQ